MTIRAILFDADGVIQTTAATFIPQLKSLIIESERAEQFLAEIFVAEKPCLLGQKDFAQELALVLNRWNVKTPVPQVLAIWEWIQPVSAVMDKIATIRNSGIYCYLATNQQSYRADYMRATFHYNTLFDGAFYSYEVGTAKPDKLYFQSVLSQLSIPSSEILFIDDKAANIAAARTCGMQASLFDAQATERPGAVLSTVLRTFDIP